MSIVEDLKARGNINGFYLRPAGSDSYPPKPGTAVQWVAAQPVQDMLEQGKRLKWKNLGTIGNVAHLQKHGDHTGHSYGKVRGVVYAKDTELPPGGKEALLSLCRKANYDTSWIDFFNVGGRQYNYAGKDVGPSGDQHLHISVRRGAELIRVPIFEDIAAVLNGTFGQVAMPDAFHRLGFVAGAVLVQPAGSREVWLSGRGKRTLVRNTAELVSVREYLESRGMQDGILPVTALTGVVV